MLLLLLLLTAVVLGGVHGCMCVRECVCICMHACMYVYRSANITIRSLISIDQSIPAKEKEAAFILKEEMRKNRRKGKKKSTC